MNKITKMPLIIACAALCGCHAGSGTESAAVRTSVAVSEKAKPVTQTPMDAGGHRWAPYFYAVQAGGPNVINPITNAPKSNHVRVFFKNWSGDNPDKNVGFFGLTNEESRDILLWNVRVQVPSKGKGTDGFGWDTVYDNYPTGTPNCDRCVFPPGSSGEFQVERPCGKPWRVCILYSIKTVEAGKGGGNGTHYGGNYEVISQKMEY
jgi:hypothetical protein